MATTTDGTNLADVFGSGRTGLALIAFAVFAAAAVLFFWGGLAGAAAAWSREEYSYGYIVPFIAAYLFLRRLPEASAVPPRHRWLGPLVVLVAVAFGLIGGLSRIADLSSYGFILALAGGLVALFGLRATMRLWVPLAYLLFMVPLPQVVYLKLSAGMQLISSELGVLLIRAFDIPVLLEGNVIDLGGYQLQVAEACSGLRYLFPLMSFGFLFAVLYRGPRWHKWVLFLSTVPITIAMNSLRVGIIGVLVNSYGIGMAEGFLHFFQGWVIFLGCVLVLFVVAFLLLRTSGRRMPLREAFDLRLDRVPSLSQLSAGRSRPLAVLLAAGVVAAGLFLLEAYSIREANASVPPRNDFIGFPTRLGAWQGYQAAISPDVLEVLAADDYLYATYGRTDGAGLPVNLFVAYYGQQTDGRAVHSPEACLPGDGWQITSFQTTSIDVPSRPQGFSVNRAVIQKGLSRALVYYWFEERGRTVTNEYMAKWYILWDGVLRDRTDGALVRLVTPIAPRDDGESDRRLVRFIAAMGPSLQGFLPD